MTRRKTFRRLTNDIAKAILDELITPSEPPKAPYIDSTASVLAQTILAHLKDAYAPPPETKGTATLLDRDGNPICRVPQ